MTSRNSYSNLEFFKLHGLGNDFVFVDTGKKALSSDELINLSKSVCDRRFGVGADGVITFKLIAPNQVELGFFNSDGSLASMCGNGMRCAAHFARLYEYWQGDSPLTLIGPQRTCLAEYRHQEGYRVSLGKARFKRGEIGMLGDPAEEFFGVDLGNGFVGYAASMGNPHLIIPVEDGAAQLVTELGPGLESHPLFPDRVNVSFCQKKPGGGLLLYTWERGAGLTLACGTGAGATVAVLVRKGLMESPVLVEMQGGRLVIEIDADYEIWQTGPAELVFSGNLCL